MSSYLKFIYVVISLTCGFKLVKCKYDVPTSSEFFYNPNPSFIAKPKAEIPQFLPLYPVYQESFPLPNSGPQYLEENEGEALPKLVTSTTLKPEVASKSTASKPQVKTYPSLPPAVSYQSYNYEIKTDKEKDSKRNYGYKYEVNDFHSGDYKSVYEKGTPEKVEGGYHVIVPGNSVPKQAQTIYKLIYVLPKSEPKFLSIPDNYESPYSSLKNVLEKTEE